MFWRKSAPIPRPVPSALLCVLTDSENCGKGRGSLGVTGVLGRFKCLHTSFQGVEKTSRAACSKGPKPACQTPPTGLRSHLFFLSFMGTPFYCSVIASLQLPGPLGEKQAKGLVNDWKLTHRGSDTHLGETAALIPAAQR